MDASTGKGAAHARRDGPRPGTISAGSDFRDLPEGPIRTRLAKVVRSLLSFLELQIPMAFGALVCFTVVNLIAFSSFATAYRPGTYLYATGDILFLTAPVVAWMIYLGRGWRQGLAVAGAMLVPVAAIIVLGGMAGSAYLAWLTVAGYPAMSLGMLAYIVYRSREQALGSVDGRGREGSVATFRSYDRRHTGRRVGEMLEH